MEKGDSWRAQLVCDNVYAFCILWICYLVRDLPEQYCKQCFITSLCHRYSAHLVEFEGVPFSDIIGVRTF